MQENKEERRVGEGEGGISGIVWALSSAIPDFDYLINFVFLYQCQQGSCCLHSKESWLVQELSLNEMERTFNKQDEKKEEFCPVYMKYSWHGVCME